jgi:hypothetical protein
MGCEVCSNKSVFYIEKIPINNITLQSKRNLNYLLTNEINFNEKKYSIESNVSSNHGFSTSNNNEKFSYLENMREEMFNEINLIRSNPEIIIEKINKYLPFIITIDKESFIQVDKNNKIKLNKGKITFEQCKSYISKKKPLQPLILKKELTFPFPEDFEENMNDDFIKKNYLTSTLKQIKNNLSEKNLDLVNFHYDIMNSNIELTTLLQIVDDTNSMNQRRNNIFSKSSKYIGINVGKMSNGLYCFYLLFGKDKN